ncbi:MAG: hypothetical protein FJ265_06715 [Planctomycetes bacterium]|nr:hypothetical protein [Planctomycetota bacterium]
MRHDLVIAGGARTAMAEYSGTPGFGRFKDVTAIDLAAHAAKAALQRCGVKPEMVDETFVGNATQSSSDALYGARHVARKAGVPIDKPALTVNRICGSGIQSVVCAAHANLIEINEAFAAQYLGCEKELQLDRDKVNVNGGAIALGHPLGATGARLLLTLLRELEQSGKPLGCASACIGGGQGIAMILERL